MAVRLILNLDSTAPCTYRMIKRGGYTESLPYNKGNNIENYYSDPDTYWSGAFYLCFQSAQPSFLGRY